MNADSSAELQGRHPNPRARVHVRYRNPGFLRRFFRMDKPYSYWIHDLRFPLGGKVRYLESPIATVTSNRAYRAAGSSYNWIDVLIIAWVDSTGRYNEVEVPSGLWHLVEVISVP